jgi:hypothetical protein
MIMTALWFGDYSPSLLESVEQMLCEWGAAVVPDEIIDECSYLFTYEQTKPRPP